jgi:hypothetical protein
VKLASSLTFGSPNDNDAVYTGTVLLRIVSPTEIESEPSQYHVSCNA